MATFSERNMHWYLPDTNFMICDFYHDDLFILFIYLLRVSSQPDKILKYIMADYLFLLRHLYPTTPQVINANF